ncbi:hypothetical protein D3C76_1192850 [compost metagenome]
MIQVPAQRIQLDFTPLEFRNGFITQGPQQALDLLARIVRVQVQHPTFPRPAQAQPVPYPTHGIANLARSQAHRRLEGGFERWHFQELRQRDLV